MSRAWSLLLIAPAIWGQSAFEIAQKAQERTQAQSEHYTGTLQVIAANHKVSEKRWTFDRIGSHGNSKAILRFTAPAEVKGVALLIVNHPDRASDQWMWTPALERDRRIALQDRSTRFFGTDFSFEDLEERDTGQFDYKMLGEETLDQAACWKLESKPKEAKSSQYTLSQLWIRKDNYVIVRIDHYKKDTVARRILYSNVQNVQNIWTPMKIDIADLAKNSRTEMVVDNLKYNLPMRDSDFSIEALRHAQ